MGKQMAGSELRHLACADQVNALALQVAKDLFRQVYCDRSDRDGRSCDRSFVAYSLGDCEGPGQQRVQLRVDAAHRARGRIGLFYLSKNLRLADHHRVQAGGDAEDMPHRIALVILVQVLAEWLRIDAVKLAEEFAQVRMVV